MPLINELFVSIYRSTPKTKTNLVWGWILVSLWAQTDCTGGILEIIQVYWSIKEIGNKKYYEGKKENLKNWVRHSWPTHGWMQQKQNLRSWKAVCILAARVQQQTMFTLWNLSYSWLTNNHVTADILNNYLRSLLVSFVLLRGLVSKLISQPR